jgi:hypothetical protein
MFLISVEGYASAIDANRSSNAAPAKTRSRHKYHNGMLSCFFQGFSNALFRNFRKPKAIRFRVECG